MSQSLREGDFIQIEIILLSLEITKLIIERDHYNNQIDMMDSLKQSIVCKQITTLEKRYNYLKA